MSESLPYLLSGCLFGLVAGVSPGPLLALVVSETLIKGRRAGLLVCAAPLVTDAPIVALSLYVLARLSNYNSVLGVIALAGAGFISYMAYGSLTAKGGGYDSAGTGMHPLGKGVLVNALSPHPYLFWMSVGGPMVIKAYSSGYAPATAYIAGFYACLVGSKVAAALLVARSRDFLRGPYYVYLLRALGAALLFFAAMFVSEGLVLLGVWLRR